MHAKCSRYSGESQQWAWAWTLYNKPAISLADHRRNPIAWLQILPVIAGRHVKAVVKWVELKWFDPITGTPWLATPQVTQVPTRCRCPRYAVAWRRKLQLTDLQLEWLQVALYSNAPAWTWTWNYIYMGKGPSPGPRYHASSGTLYEPIRYDLVRFKIIHTTSSLN